MSDKAVASMPTSTLLMEKIDSLESSLINTAIRTELNSPKALETSIESTSSPDLDESAEIPENENPSVSNPIEIQDIDGMEKHIESSGGSINNLSRVTVQLGDSNKDETLRTDDISDYQKLEDTDSNLECSPKEEIENVEDASINRGEKETCQTAKRKLEDTCSEHEGMSKKIQVK